MSCGSHAIELSDFYAEVACLPRPHPLTTWIPLPAAVSSKCAARCSNVSDGVAGTTERATHPPEFESLETPMPVAQASQFRGYIGTRASSSSCPQLSPPPGFGHPLVFGEASCKSVPAQDLSAEFECAVPPDRTVRCAGALKRTDSPVDETFVDVRPTSLDETPSVHPLSLVESC